MPRWIEEIEVVEINKRLLAATSEPHSLLDVGKLSSAVARPRQLLAYRVDADIFDLAAEYVFGVANNHPFLNGNKRTAYATAAVFLRLNGLSPKGRRKDAVSLVVALVIKTASTADMADWFRNTSRVMR